MEFTHVPPPGRWFVLILAVALFAPMISPATPVQGATFNQGQLVRFVKSNLPQQLGTIREKDSRQAYVVIPDNASVSGAVPVQVIRQRTRSDGTVSSRAIARGRFVPVSESQARIEFVSGEAPRVQVGDIVRLLPVHLYVQNRTSIRTDRLMQSLRSLPQIGRVEQGVPANFPESEMLQVVFEVQTRGAYLKKAGDWAAFASLTPSASRAPAEGGTPQGSSLRNQDIFLEEKVRIERPVRSFSWLRLPRNPGVKIVCLGSMNELGFARWSNELQALRWHPISYGQLLDVSVLRDQVRNARRVPLLVVSQRNGVLFSTFYEYDLVDRELAQRWTERNLWISRRGNRVFAHQVGTQRPFETDPVPVRVTRDGWEWVNDSQQGSKVPEDTLLFGMDTMDQITARLTGNGYLQVYQGLERVASSREYYGGLPYKVNPREQIQERSQTIHPAPLIWKQGRSNHRILVAKNVKGTVRSFFQVQRYSDGTLHLFSLVRGRLERIWDSKNLHGMITSIKSDGRSIWISLVKPDGETSVLYQILGTDVPDGTS